MNITQIENTVKKLAKDITDGMVSKDDFVYELMTAYGHRKTTVSRIKSGERNLSSIPGEVRAKRHIYFKHSASNEVLSDIDTMKKEPSVTRDKIRFVIATDFIDFLAVDTRTQDTLDIQFDELGKHFDFFLPWAGMEKAVYQGENPADVKAAEKMAKLFDLIKADNFNKENKNDKSALHNLNVFLTRLLFCFFAEDTGIFKNNQFTAELESHTKADGSDVDTYLNRLFKVLNTSKEERDDLPDYLDNFEYVNGGLFADFISAPKFSTKSRRMLIECGSELDWSGINPDIFGSMIQAVVHPDQRGGMGMHYTSVINIMKVIEPLFLDELYAELDNINENIDSKLKPSRLRKLHERIANIKIFDPACGSGNFLIIAFKELRKLEMEIMKRLQELEQTESQDDLFNDVGLDSPFSRIRLSQFYGIELDDFAHEVAILSLWLAEHQMNVEFKAEFGECEPSLPLKSSGQIVSTNAVRAEWKDICTNNLNEEVYIIGNPPYLGFKGWDTDQKKDMDYIFKSFGNAKRLDYIACWFKKAADYIQNSQAKFAFVTTNSITQGEQVSLIWPYIFDLNLEIFFAFTSFKWKNNAKSNAGVTVAIIGIRNNTKGIKKIFNDKRVEIVDYISPYLTSAKTSYITQSKINISGLPEMALGSSGIDGGHLILSPTERDNFILNDQRSKKFIRRYIGGNDFLKSVERYCLWINDDEVEEALEIKDIRDRIDKCRAYRESGGRDAKKAASVPHRFFYRKYQDGVPIVLPFTSSENRNYLPVGYEQPGTIISNGLFVVYDADLYLFSILSSKLHWVWTKAISGKLETRIRYSVNLVYNNFPIPTLTSEQKESLTNSALNIIEARERYPNLNLAQLYDIDSMPQELVSAHNINDTIIEAIYSANGFVDDSDRLNALFSVYNEMTGSQNA